jgi:putative phosphoribosyl transferase
METDVFKDRAEAGRLLSRRFEPWAEEGEDVLVLGLPRGGVPVAFEIAKRLRAPLDVFVVGKLGYPGQPELALGAITAAGARILNPELAESSGLSEAELDALAGRKRMELERREALYRQGGAEPEIEGRTVILVDDGTATGATLRAALQALRILVPKTLVAAVPVASRQALETLRREADAVICLRTPEPFFSVGHWYEDFGQVPDKEVVRRLEAAKVWRQSPLPRPEPIAGESIASHALAIACGEARLQGDLAVPTGAGGFVIFAHGSGSSRDSPRNRQVARTLNEAGFATLLLDLLTAEEARKDETGGEHRFDVDLLAERLVCATREMEADPRVENLPIGYFGASTGAAAALMAAARLRDRIAAVVSRGGRPDLAAEHLSEVAAACLFIVGGSDAEVLELNRDALAEIRAETRLEIIPGATHLFGEPGALEQVAALAADWFAKRMAAPAAR